MNWIFLLELTIGLIVLYALSMYRLHPAALWRGISQALMAGLTAKLSYILFTFLAFNTFIEMSYLAALTTSLAGLIFFLYNAILFSGELDEVIYCQRNKTTGPDSYFFCFNPFAQIEKIKDRYTFHAAVEIPSEQGDVYQIGFDCFVMIDVSPDKFKVIWQQLNKKEGYSPAQVYVDELRCIVVNLVKRCVDKEPNNLVPGPRPIDLEDLHRFKPDWLNIKIQHGSILFLRIVKLPNGQKQTV